MMAKLIICLCICLVVLIGSLVGLVKGVYWADSMKSSVGTIGVVIATVSGIFMIAGIAGVIAFAIKLFGFYLYGAV